MHCSTGLCVGFQVLLRFPPFVMFQADLKIDYIRCSIFSLAYNEFPRIKQKELFGVFSWNMTIVTVSSGDSISGLWDASNRLERINSVKKANWMKSLDVIKKMMHLFIRPKMRQSYMMVHIWERIQNYSVTFKICSKAQHLSLVSKLNPPKQSPKQTTNQQANSH